MSSVEIKIKGVKSVKRGKPRAKRGKRKSKVGLLEKTKMPEYSFRGLPYNYVSPPQPTYIDRPAPQLLQQQQPAIDYKPMVDSLTQQLALARIKEQSSIEQSIIPPRIYEPMDIRMATSQPASQASIPDVLIDREREAKATVKKARRKRVKTNPFEETKE